MLTLRHITTGYGKKQILTDVSFEVGEREIVLLTGGNGSGKSTVLKTIYGLLAPWPSDPEGQILFDGENITARPPADMLRRGIAYMPQKNNVFEDFTVEENLATAANIYPSSEARRRVTHVLEQLPLLAIHRKRTPFHMSGGERQLLAFGNLLVHTPKLALLDEPLAGVDTANAQLLLTQITQLQQQTNITFMIIEHKTQLFNHLPCRVLTLELGTLKPERMAA